MSISSLNNNQPGQAGSALPAQTAAYSAQNSRNQLNSVLVQSLDVSISSGKQSQTLLFHASLTNITQILNADFSSQDGSQQTQGSASLQISSTQLSISIQQDGQSDDNSPEATSKRILDGATSMFALYQQQHPELSADDQAKNFVNLIRQGFEQGYGEATDILKSLKVFNGDVQSGVEKTKDLVEKGLDAFLKSNLSSSAQSATSGTGTSQASAS
ncbi:DUF5610 domain-containing protein [Pseudogulbenkiania ferrooxidans]|uniref:DUF5610 domain-containing protein n=1 Tax=Pseudogulbenkiania ferrooxidans EGD-HP2 TaxID=1388764 RepID=A0ABP2XPW9_9NEIS|nr:DUF5610 domain-containing protein [Pseudogulbenkiania ferrooxidans]ERE13374.1 hypothetical protein O166_04320 [Pseudogulbenkiania ferrooxidans EGD-HP2]